MHIRMPVLSYGIDNFDFPKFNLPQIEYFKVHKLRKKFVTYTVLPNEIRNRDHGFILEINLINSTLVS